MSFNVRFPRFCRHEDIWLANRVRDVVFTDYYDALVDLICLSDTSRLFVSLNKRVSSHAPAIEVYREDDEYRFEADVPIERELEEEAKMEFERRLPRGCRITEVHYHIAEAHVHIKCDNINRGDIIDIIETIKEVNRKYGVVKY